MENFSSPEQLADLIDELMADGSGHVNIKSAGSETGIKVDIVNSTDYCGNKGACCQPTENAADDDED